MNEQYAPETAAALSSAESQSTAKTRPAPGSNGNSWRWKEILAWIALPCGLGLEIYLGWRTWVEPLATVYFAACSCVAGLLTGIGLARLSGINRWLAFWLYAGLALFIPVYGALGGALIALYQRRGSNDKLADRYKDYIDSEEDEGEEPAQATTVDQMIHRELGIQSYMDIIRGPDRAMKKALIGKILNEWTPGGIQLLQEALKDADYEIRSYGSTGLTAIEDRINKNILGLKETLKSDAHDPALKLQLAGAYLHYADSGLLDRNSTSHYVQMAKEAMDQPVSELDAELHFEHLLLQGQAARLLGDSASARVVYAEILQRKPEHQETLVQQCDLLFRNREFAQLRQTSAKLSPVKAAEHPAFAAVQLWRDEPQPEENAS